MSITLTEKMYHFNELDDKAKEKARAVVREYMDDWNVDCVKESLDYYLASIGFSGASIYFSLNYCQGDGACFEIKEPLDVEKLLFYQKAIRKILAADGGYVQEFKRTTSSHGIIPGKIIAVHGAVDDKGRVTYHINHTMPQSDDMRWVEYAVDDYYIGHGSNPPMYILTGTDYKKEKLSDEQRNNLKAALLDDSAVAALALLHDIECQLNITIAHTDHMYCHYNTMDVTVDIIDEGNIGDLSDKLRSLGNIDAEFNICSSSIVSAVSDATDRLDELVEQLCDEVYTGLSALVKRVSKQMEAIGYADLEYMQSDEHIDCQIEDADFVFFKNGTQVLNMTAADSSVADDDKDAEAADNDLVLYSGTDVVCGIKFKWHIDNVKPDNARFKFGFEQKVREAVCSTVGTMLLYNYDTNIQAKPLVVCTTNPNAKLHGTFSVIGKVDR